MMTTETAPKPLRKHAHKIHDVSRDPEGNWWVELSPGWFCTETETHCITESTIEQCARRFVNVVRCNCEDCDTEKGLTQ